MSTTKKVAELAGVSIATVSNVLTGSVRVSARLQEKVEDAIRKLDYHPNHVARSLKTSRTRILGVIVPDMTIPFFPQIIRGAEAAALQRKYSLIAVNSDDSSQRQSELLSLLRSQRVEGILVVLAAGAAPTVQMSRIVEAGIPMVCLDRIPDGVRMDSVSVDNADAAEMGVSHLLAMGHTEIAIATGALTLRNERERVQGYRNAFQKAGLKPAEAMVWEGNFRPADVAGMCCRHLLSGRGRPSAIFATNGPTGLGVLRALRTCHLETPADIGFATFDELTAEDIFSPVVTTVVQPAFDIGFRGAEILLDQLHHGAGRGDPIQIRLPASLKIGDSSKLSVRVGRRVQRHAG